MAAKGMDELALLKVEYAEALIRNKKAKAQLKEVLEHSRAQTGSRGARTPSIHDHLAAHLDTIRLQQQYAKLQTLAHYSGKADEIARELKLYEPLDTALDGGSSINSGRNNENVKPEDLAKAQRRVNGLIDSAQNLNTNLELALVRARQLLKREQSLFEYARAQSHERHDGNDSEVKLKALEATRDKLQTWIGDSLAACEQEMTIPNAELLTLPKGNESDQTTDETGADVETEYEKYIEARRRLLSATVALRSPLPALASDALNLSKSTTTKTLSSTSQITTIQRPLHLRPRSQVSISGSGENQPNPSLAEIQSSHLPEYYHEKLLSTNTSHLKDQTLAQDFRLLQVLNLLSHESHLLPAHSMPSTTTAHEESADSARLNQQQIDINRLLGAWAFASDRAGEVLASGVQGHVRDASGALARARGSVEEMYVMEGMKKEVEGTAV